LDILFARSSEISYWKRIDQYRAACGGRAVQEKEGHANLLISPRLLILAQQLLHILDAAHFFVDLLQHCCALLQAIQHIFLHKREFDIGGQDLELRQLRIRL
jgi:hypothetical protein